MNGYGSATRFLRPIDVERTRRNRRQVQVQKILIIAANLLLAATLFIAALWLYQKTTQDRRFAITHVEILGSDHVSPSDLALLAGRYRGRNLFKMEIAGIRSDFAALPWVEHIAIGKKLPGTLTIRIFERKPAALLMERGVLRYVDRDGVVIAPLSAAVGNPELPLVAVESRQELPALMHFLTELRDGDPLLFARVSEIRPVDGGGVRIFERELRTFVILQTASDLEKWKTLYPLVSGDGYAPSSIEYADLRFQDRIVIKPRGDHPRVNRNAVSALSAAGLSATTRASSD
ncbi:MAG: FtsQ-type POTRA domain-containing protein [Acidobacteriota bacterium]